MIIERTANLLTLATVAFLLYMGISFLIDPLTTITGFGLPQSIWPSGDGAAAVLNVKGDRDLACGLMILVLLILRQPKALGWVLLASSVAPIIDGTIVLSYGGDVAAAFGIHFLAAAFVIVTGLLQLRVAKKG